MKRRTQLALYHLLPVVFWLLAIGGCVLPFIFSPVLSQAGWKNLYLLIPALVVMLCMTIIGRLRLHDSSVEQCFITAIMLGVASFWLPTLLFFIIPVWIYLTYRNLFSMQSFTASLLGYALVAVWAAIFIWLGWISNPWADFFAKENAYGWIPVSAFIIARFAATTARQNLRVR
jgi:hypothetical protein